MPPTPVDLQAVQLARRGATAAIATLMIAVTSSGQAWPLHHSIHENIEAAGLLAILIAIVGRCWCTLYIGGRKATRLVQAGPYSICRNPLYVFTLLGSWGVGAQSGSIILSLVVAFLVWIVIRTTIAHEERFLAAAHGVIYNDYARRTPRFIPNLRLWQEPYSLEVQPQLVARTFRDGLLFLIAVPLAEGLEAIQAMGLLPVLLPLV